MDGIIAQSRGKSILRINIVLDDKLVAKAQAFTGRREKSSLVHEALKALIARESGVQLASIGGSETKLTVASRRRQKPEL